MWYTAGVTTAQDKTPGRRTFDDGTPVTPRTVIERFGRHVNVYCRCAPNGVVSGNIRVSDGIEATFDGKTVRHCPACGRYWQVSK